MIVGFAVRVTVGPVPAPPPTVMVTVLLMTVEPMQATRYVVVWAGVTVTEPSVSPPVRNPVPRQLPVFALSHVRVTLSPGLIVVSLAVKVRVGAGAGGGSGGGVVPTMRAMVLIACVPILFTQVMV
jgi:hypothetical protein